MSKNHPDDNIYSILGKLKALEPTPAEVVKERAQQIRESVESQGSILKGLRDISTVEQRLNEKYQGFEKTAAAVAKNPKVRDPEAVAAAIGRKKYGKAKFQKAAAAGKKMGEQNMGAGTGGMEEHAIKENGLQRYTGIKKYGKKGFEALQKAGRDGASEEEKGRIKDQYIKKEGVEQTDCMECGMPMYECVCEDIASMGGAQGTMGGVVGESANCDDCGKPAYKCVCEGEKHATKKGFIHKGNYGGEYDVGADSDKENRPAVKKPSKKKKAPSDSGTPVKKGRKPGTNKTDKEKGFSSNKSNDPFGRTPDSAPKGEKGRVIKGKGNIDTVDEVITKKTSSGDIIHDFVHSKNKKFAGKSKAQRTKQALGAYYGMHPEKSRKESRMNESVNFKGLADRHRMSMEECMNTLNDHFKHYQETGECSDLLNGAMHMHRQATEESGPIGYEKPAVHRKAAGEAPLTIDTIHKQDAGRSMHPGMTKLDAPEPNKYDELDQIAALAGLNKHNESEMEEGNAFTGAVANAKAHHQDTFDFGGHEYNVTDEGNEFSGELAKARAKHADSFSVDGKTYPVKEDPMMAFESDELNELAKLAGLEIKESTMSETDMIVNSVDDALEDGGDLQAAIVTVADVYDMDPREVHQLYIRHSEGGEHLPNIDFGDFDDGEDDTEGFAEADAPVEEPVEPPVNRPKNKYYSIKNSTDNDGEGDFGRKRMYPPAAMGDNPMVKPARGIPLDGYVKENENPLKGRLAAEYESIKKLSR